MRGKSHHVVKRLHPTDEDLSAGTPFYLGQAARILDAMARASSHICGGSSSVATSHKSMAALRRIAASRVAGCAWLTSGLSFVAFPPMRHPTDVDLSVGTPLELRGMDGAPGDRSLSRWVVSMVFYSERWQVEAV